MFSRRDRPAAELSARLRFKKDDALCGRVAAEVVLSSILERQQQPARRATAVGAQDLTSGILTSALKRRASMLVCDARGNNASRLAQK